MTFEPNFGDGVKTISHMAFVIEVEGPPLQADLRTLRDPRSPCRRPRRLGALYCVDEKLD